MLIMIVMLTLEEISELVLTIEKGSEALNQLAETKARLDQVEVKLKELIVSLFLTNFFLPF